MRGVRAVGALAGLVLATGGPDAATIRDVLGHQATRRDVPLLLDTVQQTRTRPSGAGAAR